MMRKLSEHYVQWILLLNKYNLKIKYHSKKNNERTDALSKCVKWMNTMSYVSVFNFRPVWKRIIWNCVKYKRVNDESKWWSQTWSFIFVLIWKKRHFYIHNQTTNSLNNLWKTAEMMNIMWKQIKKTIIQNVWKFFSNVIFKILIFRCIIKNKTLCFKKNWISENKKLRMKLI